MKIQVNVEVIEVQEQHLDLCHEERMKLSPETIEILKNFSSIRPTLTIQEGNQLKTMSPSFGVRAFAQVKETFSVPCVLHDLPKFVNNLALGENELAWGKKAVQINYINGSVGKYGYSNWGSNGNPDDIKRGDDSNPLIKFRLTNDAMEEILKALTANRHTTIAFVGEGGKLGIAAMGLIKGVEKPNTYTKPMGETDKRFRVYLDVEKLKILPRDYDVTIVEKKFVRFASPGLDYYIAMSMDSEFK